MTTIAIMQPTYIPWLGYFALMDQVDTFVYLDSVQFDKRSWQQRNRIKNQNGVQLLTIPVISKGLRAQTIKEVQIDKTSNFAAKHIRSISMSYSKTPYFNEYKDDFFSILKNDYKYLSDLTINIILFIKDLLGIKCKFEKSSLMNIEGKKAGLLANICKYLSADTYISPVGSETYLEKSTEFLEKDIKIKYNDYIHPMYNQPYGNFISHLSIIDLLFNEGHNSLNIIQKGYK